MTDRPTPSIQASLVCDSVILHRAVRPSTYCTSTPQALRTPRTGLTTRLRDFATNCHEYCWLAGGEKSASGGLATRES